MLKKQHRLAKTKDVQKAFARGRGFFNPFFTLRFLKNPASDRRLTVVVSTKVSKKAVARNRIKRLLREFVRVRLNELAPGDYAIVVKPAAIKLEVKDLLASFEKLLASSRLYGGTRNNQA